MSITPQQQIDLVGSPVSLTLMTDADWPLYFCLYGDPKVMRFIGQAMSEEVAKKKFAKSVGQMDDAETNHLSYVIRDVSGAQGVGIVGVIWHDQGRRALAEVGVMIHPNHRRKRMAHHAKRLLISHVIKHHQAAVVEAVCEADNEAANRANQVLGLKQGRTFVDPKRGILKQVWYTNPRHWQQRQC